MFLEIVYAIIGVIIFGLVFSFAMHDSKQDRSPTPIPFGLMLAAIAGAIWPTVCFAISLWVLGTLAKGKELEVK